MARYECKCENEKCEKYEEVIIANIPMTEYSEDKLPVCEACGQPTKRIYSSGGMLKTAGDGIKI